MLNLKKLATDNAVLLLQYAVGGITPALLVPHIVREIGLEPFGSLAIALAWASYGSLVVQYAFQLTGPKSIAHLSSAESHEDVFCRIALSKLLLLSITLLVSITASLFIEKSRITPAQLLILLTLPIATAMNSGWYLQSIGRFPLVSLISIIGAAISLAIGFGMLSQPPKHRDEISAVALVAGQLFAGVGTMIASLFCLNWRAVRPRWGSAFVELAQGWPLFMSQLTAGAYGLSGPIVIGAFVGKNEAGAYTAVEKVVRALMGGCLLTHTAAYPKLASIYRENPVEYLKFVRQLTVVYLLIASSVIAVWLCFWDSMDHYLFGGIGISHPALVAGGLVWFSLGIFGTVVTGYYTISGQAARVFPLTIQVMFFSLSLGILGVALLGSWAWMMALALAQFPVLVAARSIWRSENSDTRVTK